MFAFLKRVVMATPVLLFLLPGIAFAQQTHRNTVDFGGWSGSTIDGEVEGRDRFEYQVFALPGDTMSVQLHSASNLIVFDVYAPGEGPGDQPIANSRTISPTVPARNIFRSTLSRAGTYTIAVHLGGDAAQRGNSAFYSVEFDVLADAQAGDPGAEPLTFQVRTRSAGGHLNIHSAPDIDAPRIGRVNNGSILSNVDGCDVYNGREWCEVMVMGGGTTGYAAREFMTGVQAMPAGRGQGLAPARPQPMSALRPTPHIVMPVSSSSEYFHVHLPDPTRHLNVHASPSVNATLIGRFPDGADLANIGGCTVAEGRSWCEIMAAGGGISGWAAAEYLRDGHPPAAHIAIAPISGDTADGLSGGPDYWQVALSTSGSALRVHGQPSRLSNVFARFPNGAILRNEDGCRLSGGERWCFVSSVTGDVRGWVAGAFLVEGSDPGVAVHLPEPVPAEPLTSDPALNAELALEDELVAGTNFNAVGYVRCAFDGAAEMDLCEFGVVREGSGNGYLSIRQPDSTFRVIHFEQNAPVYYIQADDELEIEMNVTMVDDSFVVGIGADTYDIPSAAMTGG